MLIIESYKVEYKEQIQDICHATCWEHFKKNQKLQQCMNLMYVDYYMDFEPHNVLVAKDSESGNIAGYIVFSTNPKLYKEKNLKVFFPEILKRCFYLAIFHLICVNQSLKYDKIYGGGFHINISPDYQKQGAGKLLMDAAAKKLKDQNIQYMYLITASRKTTGYKFYTHIGFKEVHRYINGTIALAKPN